MSQQQRKKAPKIEPFRYKVELDPKYAEKTWKILEDAIHEIYNHNASGLSFEELYRNAYNMILHKYGDRLYSGLVKTMTQQLVSVARSVESVQGELFLSQLNRKWSDHNKSLQMIRDILMYMDRTYVVNSRKTPVYELGLNLWREEVVRSPCINERIQFLLLDLIHKERTGEVIDRGLMRSTIKMLLDLGPQVYQIDFETPFLNATAKFYQMESAQFLETCDCSGYLKKAERRWAEEMERVKTYLDSRSEAKVAEVIDSQMIGNHLQLLVERENSGMVAMIENGSYEDLGRMYMLFKRVPEGIKTMLDVMSAHLRQVGKDLVTDPERAKDPVDFVQRLLDEKDKYDKLVQIPFANDRGFQNALNASFEYFVNLNSRSPEFISLFLDDKLRKGLKGLSEDEAEIVLDKIIVIFRFLQEKDVFEKYYKQHLAKRLLSGRTVSDDAERSFIVKLKTECGYQFTSKLEGMFTDMKMSKETMADFLASLAASAEIVDSPSLSVQVLTTGSWPTQVGPVCNLPSELHSICEKFSSHYLSTHTGRRLTWHTHLGTADIKAQFSGGKYELNVSTHQMCILMLFNSKNSMSYSSIEMETGIPPADLKRNLQSLALVKGKNVLRKEPVGKEVAEEDMFHFNDKFTSKFFKVKIGTVTAQKESEPEKQETREKVEEDRKPQIEAAIVRVMKSRRVLDHNNVVSEVTAQLQSRFMPNPVVIKKRIESLIEREFLERDKADRKLYRYLA